jgi:hypothetical protein
MTSTTLFLCRLRTRTTGIVRASYSRKRMSTAHSEFRSSFNVLILVPTKHLTSAKEWSSTAHSDPHLTYLYWFLRSVSTICHQLAINTPSTIHYLYRVTLLRRGGSDYHPHAPVAHSTFRILNLWCYVGTTKVWKSLHTVVLG